MDIVKFQWLFESSAFISLDYIMDIDIFKMILLSVSNVRM